MTACALPIKAKLAINCHQHPTFPFSSPLLSRWRRSFSAHDCLREFFVRRLLSHGWPLLHYFLCFLGIPRVPVRIFPRRPSRHSTSKLLPLLTMDDTWGQICHQCVDVVADVPVSVLLVTLLATVVGLFVLVSRSRLFARIARGLPCPNPEAMQVANQRFWLIVLPLPILCRAGSPRASARRKEVQDTLKRWSHYRIPTTPLLARDSRGRRTGRETSQH